MVFGNNPERNLLRPEGHSFGSAVVSGDSDNSSLEDGSNADIFEDAGRYGDDHFGEIENEHPEIGHQYASGDSTPADDLFDRNLDEEDEAYVYQNLRGGVKENVALRQRTTNAKTKKQEDNNIDFARSSETTAEPLQALRPRDSDAVLSCPCCFNIVCMDCQRHKSYANQFRAMFVMGITVNWHSRLVYDEDERLLIPKQPSSNPHFIPDELNDIGEREEKALKFNEGEYFPVLCQNCRTQVAALDMIEEVYHFHGCLESA